jgi:hypothetical protein
MPAYYSSSEAMRTCDVYRLPGRQVATILRGLTCLHPCMKSCCKPCCGHLHCPDCGLTWDTHSEC